MDLSGEYVIPASRETVWEALNNPDILRECIPGCEVLEMQSPTQMSATVVTKIGPVKAKFSGEVTLVTDDGEEILTAGDAAGFKAGEEDGHCFQNRSDADVVLLEIGTRIPEDFAWYSDIDMRTSPDGQYLHRDGTPYPKQERRSG